MIKPKQVTIGKMKFDLKALPALTAARLDKRVLALLIPVFGGLSDFSLDAKIDMEGMAQGLSKALGEMKDHDFETLMVEMLSTSAYLPAAGVPQELTAETINMAFRGELITLYKLLFEVMKFNKFSPFELVGGGNGLLSTFISKNLTGTEKDSGKNSDPLVT